MATLDPQKKTQEKEKSGTTMPFTSCTEPVSVHSLVDYLLLPLILVAILTTDLSASA